MKIYINGTKEISNIGSVIERVRKDNSCVLDINFNDSEHAPDELKTMFEDVTSVKVVRIDLNGNERSTVYTEYTQVDKIQRKINDETDITTVSLVRAVKAETEGGEDNDKNF